VVQDARPQSPAGPTPIVVPAEGPRVANGPASVPTVRRPAETTIANLVVVPATGPAPGPASVPGLAPIAVSEPDPKTGRLTADRISRVVKGKQTIVRTMSVAVEPGELVTIIGPSGAGKTVLLEILAGLKPPSTGVVKRVGAGADGVGFVPQEDIIHRDLPLGRVLRYAARLRLPGTADNAAIEAAVESVLTVLRLKDREKTKVSRLSGGERKRASIAVELLAQPRFFFLDEPTSGLDPATAAELMRALRRIADAGCTVVMTSRNPPDVDLCDRVLVIAAGGGLAFAGTPAKARDFFDVPTINGIYTRLVEHNRDYWLRRFADDRAGRTDLFAIPTTTGPLPRISPDIPDLPAERPEVGAFRQWFLLTVRALDVLVHKRLTLLIVLGSPVAILLMFLMLFQPGAFDPAHPVPNTSAMILFWIAFGGFFFGLTYGLLQICTEFPIFFREHSSGVRIWPYVLSKLAALLPLLILVDALLLAVLHWTDRLPKENFGQLAALFATLLLASVCAMALGLLTSAAVSEPGQATLMLPALCFPQVLFVGAFLPVPVMALAGRWLSFAMSNRWAFEALGHTAGVEDLWRTAASPLGRPLLASYQDTFARPVWIDWLIIAGMAAVFLVATWLVLNTKATRRGGRPTR
jgi:ABC-type multidrug transport system ATPase subunit